MNEGEKFLVYLRRLIVIDELETRQGIEAGGDATSAWRAHHERTAALNREYDALLKLLVEQRSAQLSPPTVRQ